MLPRILSALSSRIPTSLSLAWFTAASSSSSTMAPIQELVDSKIAENRVVIFSKSYCPYCTRAKNLFAQNFPGVKAEVLELDERDDGSAIQEYLRSKTGQRTVPNVFVDQQHIGGSDDTSAAFASGKLAKLLNASLRL